MSDWQHDGEVRTPEGGWEPRQPPERDDEPTRVWREAMALPLGTVAIVEGKRAVLVGQVAGPRRWQWMDGGWTAIPLGAVEALGHVDDVGPLSDEALERTAEALHAAMWGTNTVPGMKSPLGVHAHTTDPVEHEAQREFLRRCLRYVETTTREG